MKENNNCCLANALKVIEVLQKNVSNPECCKQGCSQPFLGNTSRALCFNTRPVTFYTCDTEILEISYTNSAGETVTSSVFRVEKVEGCCCTCRLLEVNPESTDPNSPYIQTSQFTTINLNCIAAIKCLPDVIVNCL